MLTEWLLVAFGLVLAAGNAVFVAAEFSLVTLDPALVDEDPSMDDRRGQTVRKALHQLSTQLSSAQVGITLTTVLLGYTTQPAIVRLLDAAVGRTAVSAAVATVIAVVGAIIVVNGFSMLIGELVPKNFAIARPIPTARAVAPAQLAFTAALRPVIAWSNGTANALLRAMGVTPREELSGARSAPELAALVRRSEQAGTLEAGTARLLTNSLDFAGLTAIDVMTDRGRVAWLPREATAADVVDAARRTGHSRFPVIEDSPDDVVGLVHVRKAIAVPYEKRPEVPAAALMVDAPRVPETVHLGPLLGELRDAAVQMALVVDEYGGTSGVVTFEDVVEELVGEVADEHDPRVTGVRRGLNGTWLVPGVVRPDELAEQTGVLVPEGGPYETLGGLVMDTLGRIPEMGDEVEAGGARLQVEEMDGLRVQSLRVWPPPESDDDGGHGRAGGAT